MNLVLTSSAPVASISGSRVLRFTAQGNLVVRPALASMVQNSVVVVEPFLLA